MKKEVSLWSVAPRSPLCRPNTPTVSAASLKFSWVQDFWVATILVARPKRRQLLYACDLVDMKGACPAGDS